MTRKSIFIICLIFLVCFTTFAAEEAAEPNASGSVKTNAESSRQLDQHSVPIQPEQWRRPGRRHVFQSQLPTRDAIQTEFRLEHDRSHYRPGRKHSRSCGNAL